MKALHYLISTAFFLHASTASNVNRAIQSAPSATVRNGTVIGQSDGRVDNFTGIPFAQPPVGPLRLKPPHSINASFGSLQLPLTARACPQQSLSSINTTGLPAETLQALEAAGNLGTTSQSGEDCLTLTVQRPAGTKSDAKLPVLFWIYGGGYQVGATSEYDGTNILTESIAINKPIIFVAVNYRLSAFGFLGGKEIQKDGSSNLGLRDQRLALEWVAENIASFGGDPDKVTIWGESAGSTSVFNQLTINRGNNSYSGKPLFRAAIMDSGSAIPVAPVDSPRPQDDYDQVVLAAGCSNATNSLECLRSVSFDKFSNASSSLPNFTGYYGVGLGLSYLPRGDASNGFFPYSPDEALSRGLFAQVPIIIGDQEDEGTLFSLQQRNLTTTTDVINYYAPQYLMATREDVAGLVATYPDDPAAGSPYHTGTANQLYSQYKRLASINGDLLFTLRRRLTLAVAAKAVPAWSYLANYRYGLPFLGTYHTSDILEIYEGTPNKTLGSELSRYYINFVAEIDPNGKDLHQWPRYDVEKPQLLNISSGRFSTVPDTFRQRSYEYLMDFSAKFSL